MVKKEILFKAEGQLELDATRNENCLKKRIAVIALSLIAASGITIYGKSLYCKTIPNNDPIEFLMGVRCDAPVTLQVFFSEDSRSKFSEKYSIKHQLSALPDFQDVVFSLPANKISHLRVDTGDGSSSVYIRSARLGPQTDIPLPESISEKSRDIDNIIQDKNGIVTVSAKGPDPYFCIADQAIEIGDARQISFPIAFSLFASAFLLFLKPIQGQFLNVSAGWSKSMRPADFFFFILLAFLFVFPASKIDIKSTKNGENRMLATKPHLIKNKELNLQYGTQLEKWFSDRFRDRERVIARHGQLMFKIDKSLGNDLAILGSDGWIFYKTKTDGDPIADYRGTNYHTPEELEVIRQRVEVIQQKLKEKNMRMVLIIPPNKESIYGKHLQMFYHQKNSVSRTDLLVEYLRKNTDVSVVYPKKEMQKFADQYPLYYKTDTHWNLCGAYIGEQQILAEIGKARGYLEDQKIQSQTTTRKDLAKMLNLSGDASQSEEFMPVNCMKEDVPFVPTKQTKFQNYDAPHKDTVLLIGDSFRASLQPYLAHDFACLYVVDRKDYDPQILNTLRPDIVILEFVERFSSLIDLNISSN